MLNNPGSWTKLTAQEGRSPEIEYGVDFSGVVLKPFHMISSSEWPTIPVDLRLSEEHAVMENTVCGTPQS